jgi:hypothetical protein
MVRQMAIAFWQLVRLGNGFDTTDAFITGFAFARMAAFVNEKQLHSPFMTANDKAPNEDVHPVLAGAKKFHNELHMMFSKYKVLYLTKFGSSFADQEKNEK